MGQACSGIADSTFKAMGTANKEKWRCRTCRTGEARLGTPLSEARAHADSSKSGADMAVVNQKLDRLLTLKESVDTLLQLSAKVDILLALKPAVDKLADTVSGIEKSIAFLSSKYDTLLARTTSNEQTVKSLRTEVETLKENLSAQTSQVQRLQLELNDSEQYSRLPNMEIQGLSFSPNEDLERRLCDLAPKIGLSTFQPSDILAVHRLPAKKDKEPAVIVRFASVKLKEKWMAARNKLRSLRESDDSRHLFFNDNLTRANKELFWKTRTLGKGKGYRFIWVKNGKLFAKKDEGHSLIRVNCEADLEKIV